MFVLLFFHPDALPILDFRSTAQLCNPIHTHERERYEQRERAKPG